MLDKEQLFKLNPRDYIIQNREIGKSDQTIYNELITRFSDYNAIAKLITFTPTLENKRKYKLLNNILFALIIISVILKVISGLELATIVKNGSFLVLILPLVNLVFAWCVYNFMGSIYKYGGILALIGLGRITLNIFDSKNPIEIIAIELFLTAILSGLFFYLDNKLFPKSTFNPKITNE